MNPDLPMQGSTLRISSTGWPVRWFVVTAGPVAESLEGGGDHTMNPDHPTQGSTVRISSTGWPVRWFGVTAGPVAESLEGGGSHHES